MKQSLTKSIQSEVSARGVVLQRVISVPAVIEDVRSAFFGLCVHPGSIARAGHARALCGSARSATPSSCRPPGMRAARSKRR